MSPRRRWRVRVRWAWFDMWVGAYWDRADRVLYVCPVPMVVVAISRGWEPEW
jgi:hypothetical protein